MMNNKSFNDENNSHNDRKTADHFYGAAFPQRITTTTGTTTRPFYEDHMVEKPHEEAPSLEGQKMRKRRRRKSERREAE